MMFTVAVPVAGKVTGEGENATVEFVVRCTACGVFGGAAGAGVGVGGAAGTAGAAAPPGEGTAGEPAGGCPPNPRLVGDRSFGMVSEPVLRPRMFAS